MAHTGIFATKVDIDTKVGELVDTTGYTETAINLACLRAESVINCISRKNWSDLYATLNADVKYILTEASSCWVAIDFISYNMAGYTSRIEAEDMINVLWAKFNKCVQLLQDQRVVTFVAGA
jgi:hypothetical protein